MWWYLAGAAVGLVLGFLIFTFWDQIRDIVSNWLRQKGWQNSVLMEAIIKLDSFACGVRTKIFVKTKQTGQVLISEETYTLDQIDDPDVVAELQKRGYAERDIMSLME